MSCETARIALRNGPFYLAKWAVSQRDSGRFAKHSCRHGRSMPRRCRQDAYVMLRDGGPRPAADVAVWQRKPVRGLRLKTNEC